ncbi:hypothetical protein [Sinosporangium siamense]|uniref:Uncharacterized protein n=1 Tax=Sinosporangium siamense TaxID=1367973 RepID=A0A919RAI5_9ACTN|nr:hypothetical protein [Sinosporangium siamense]GII90143.1 hypothetical protein Ssi02_03740 [Sinosporangium siamense]
MADMGGPAPTGFHPRTRLYFISDGRLTMTTRPHTRPTVQTALDLLVQGPTAGELRRGLRTQVTVGDFVPIKVQQVGDGVRITLPKREGMSKLVLLPQPAPADWLDLAYGQLTCTAAEAVASRSDIEADRVRVTYVHRGEKKPLVTSCSQFAKT